MSPHTVEMCCSTHWDVILLDINPSSLQAILTIGARGMWMNHGGHKKKGKDNFFAGGGNYQDKKRVAHT
jgi:hypothetical protein